MKSIFNQINRRSLTAGFAVLVQKLRVSTRLLVLTFGIISGIGLILSFTHIPFYAYHHLGTQECEQEGAPDYIILMSGGGMPSADGLIRTYYAADTWLMNPEAKIIIAIPSDTTKGESSPELLMSKELVMRGIDSSSIKFQTRGFNTFTQANAIASSFDSKEKDTLVLRLITSPEHMYRAVKVFRKLDFKNVGGTAAFEQGLDAAILKKDKEKGRTGLNFRYNTWSYLQYEILVVREYIAIAYYKLRGWI